MTEAGAYAPPANPGDTLRRVLVIQLGPVGDFVQSLGAMRVIRTAHPSARITLLTTPQFQAFAKACPYFDIVEADGRPEEIRGRTELIRRLRQASYDMVYDLQANKRTEQYFAGLSGKKPLWSGAAPGCSHPHVNPEREFMPVLDRLDEQLRHAGLAPGPAGAPSGWLVGEPPRPKLDWIRPAFRDPPRFQPEYFSLYGPYALLTPGSPDAADDRRWPLDRFIALASWLADIGITPAVVGSRAEGDVGMKINRAEQRAKNLIGRTDLFQLATLTERATLVVGVEGGPLHLASAIGTPGVCLFAQDWTLEMETEIDSVWDPRTRLGRSAPRGQALFVLYSAQVKDITTRDVMKACIWTGALPEGVLVPEAPPEPAPAPDDIGDGVDTAFASDAETPSSGLEASDPTISAPEADSIEGRDS